jgi:hypothetical protein
MGDDWPVAFSVEYFPPGAGDPVPQGFQPSFADHILSLSDGCHPNSFTARMWISEIEQSRYDHGEPHGATFPINDVLPVL